jgi:DNA processing protein
MIEHGALVTDFPSHTIPDKSNFVKRNRVIAGISDATLVVESALQGGALITADIANSYNRDVLAIPGRTTDSCSRGTNFFIKTNRAALVESTEDILSYLGWAPEKKKEAVQISLFNDLLPDEVVLLKVLREKGDTPIDLLALNAQFPVSRVSATLLSLEFKGLVRCLPGKVFSPAVAIPFNL